MPNMQTFDIRCVISGTETGGQVAVFEEEIPPGGGPPRHTHRDQVEVFHILDGSLRFEVDGESFERAAGATAVVPAGAVHAFQNIGEAPAKIRFELLPAGQSEEFFETLCSGEVEDFGALFDRYGLDLAGPPLG